MPDNEKPENSLQCGIYEQIVSMAISQQLSSGNLEPDLEDLSADGSPEYLARYMQQVLYKGLIEIKNKVQIEASKDEKESAPLQAQIDACNNIIDVLNRLSNSEDILELKIGPEKKRLLALWKGEKPERPKTSIAISRLFTGGVGSGFQLANELRSEILSSNRVDFLVSFIKNSGINTIRSALEDFTSHGGKLRILTTTYMGATEPEAVRRLAELPDTEIKISYDTQGTRLHAKSYFFERDNGFSTAYIGSSNLSKAAVTDGMEWNVKITNQDAPQIVSEVRSTFENYWNSKDFVLFDPKEDYDKLCEATSRERSKTNNTLPVFNLVPYPFQEEMLERLRARREVHNSYRNLVVAATGTGKTMISAFDYRRFRESNSRSRLLFVAHRQEILNQSMNTFRAVLKDYNFGELLVGGSNISSKDHLFISIQSFNSRDFDALPSDYYDYIVVDEVHHGAAESYKALLTHFKPQILLGLTATPERMDGLDIKQYFDGEFACEIRLNEAINRELLAPFQYFAVTDPVDISGVKFVRGSFDESELSAIYVNNQERVQVIINALNRYRPVVDEVKCLGFCVSKDHARYMADEFNNYGLRAIALTSDTDKAVREKAQNDLASGKINFIFTVDLYNEGVDIKSVNTELMLRPTESKTIFIQQLGRGLRKDDGKSELVVLDFVGQYNGKYKVYEEKLRLLSSATVASLAYQVENGFQGMPLGCYIELEKIAKERILANIGTSSGGKRDLISKVRDFKISYGKNPSLKDFVERYDIDPRYIYKTKYTLAGLCAEADGKDVQLLNSKSKALGRICNIDSIRWIESIRRILSGKVLRTRSETLYATMLYYTIEQNKGDGDIWAYMDKFSRDPIVPEILQILDYNEMKIDFVEEEVDLGFEHTLGLHCTYTKDQILAAVGKSTFNFAYPWREGTLYLKEQVTDMFLININKEEKDYSPTTMYEDYPISENLFHWQSQSIAVPEKGDGLRYRTQRENGTNVLLFARESKNGEFGTNPYVFLGKGNFVSSEGRKPMSIVWEMEKEIPDKVMKWSKMYKG